VLEGISFLVVTACHGVIACNHRWINKMWVDYIDALLADKWHADVLAGLEKSADKEVATQPKTECGRP
jgi:hypothetical protein